MDINKIIKIVAGAIGIIGLFLLVRIIMIGDETLESDPSKQGIIDFFVSFAMYLLAAVALVTIVLSLLNLIKHPKSLKKTLMGIGVLLVLLAISYFMASGDAVIDPYTREVIKEGEAGSTSKWVSALINFTGILGALGLLAIGSGFVKSLVKK